MTSSDDRFLIKRSGRWHYNRRTPLRYSNIEPRVVIRCSLKTKSLEIARMRRDALEIADNNLWQALEIERNQNGNLSDASRTIQDKKHNSASARAMSLGFVYMQTDDLAAKGDTEDILQRLKLLETRSGESKVAPEAVADALLGGVEKPETKKVKMSKAFEIYLNEIVFSELFNKSEGQKKAWVKTKQTSVGYFINVIDDISMEDITRQHALAFKKWWMERMSPNCSPKNKVQPNTANRHVGNIRQLYEAYFTHFGDEERQNPFRNIYFKGEVQSRVQVFENDWVRSQILVPGVFDSLNSELRNIIYVLIETGARMSEITNLMSKDIHLETEVPYISIRPRANRQLKTPSSKRDIPLIGVAKEAFKQSPNGFPKYHDKGALVSANLMKAFKVRKLLPTKDHVIYSFRHSFEKRMLEESIDYGLRCLLMGHKNDRPSYGDGGSMSYRRNQLLKIVHPFEPNLFVN